MKLAAVIWDMDGTLTDSAALHFQAWQATMAEHGIVYSWDLFALGFGRNNFEILSEQMPHFSSAKISEVSEAKESAYRRLLLPGSLALLPGVGPWLQELHRLGMHQVVGSSAPMANIVDMVHILGIADRFHAILSGYRLPRGKPDPLLFLRCAAAADAAPAACLVIEDSIYGVQAAQRAGMPSIVIGPLARDSAIQPYVENAWPPCLAAESLAEIKLGQVLPWYTQRKTSYKEQPDQEQPEKSSQNDVV